MTKNYKYTLILASGSPRRKEILSKLGINFKIYSPNIEEKSSKSIPSDIAKDLATQKGKWILKQLKKEKDENFCIIAADTLVALEKTIFGKPKDKNDARNILRKLSGKTHQVITGVYLAKGLEEQISFHCTSHVTFEKINTTLLEDYLQTEEPYDKAGAYAIQGIAKKFITKVQGDYNNIVGLPLSLLEKNLEKIFGTKNWHTAFKIL